MLSDQTRRPAVEGAAGSLEGCRDVGPEPDRVVVGGVECHPGQVSPGHPVEPLRDDGGLAVPGRSRDQGQRTFGDGPLEGQQETITSAPTSTGRRADGASLPGTRRRAAAQAHADCRWAPPMTVSAVVTFPPGSRSTSTIRGAEPYARTMSLPRTGGSAGEEDASRRAITAACVGNAAEWYDFAIYGALATVIGVVYFPAENPATALSAAFAAYGTALLRAAARCPRLRPDGRPSRAAQRPDRGDLPHGRRHLAGRVPAGLRHDRSARPDRPPAAARRARAGRRGRARRGRGLHPGACRRSGRGRVGAWHTATMGSGIGCRHGGGGRAQSSLRRLRTGLRLVADRVPDRHPPRPGRAAPATPDHRHHPVRVSSGGLRAHRSSGSGTLAPTPGRPAAWFLPAGRRFARLQHLLHLHAQQPDRSTRGRAHPDAARDRTESWARRASPRWGWADCPIASVADPW